MDSGCFGLVGGQPRAFRLAQGRLKRSEIRGSSCRGASKCAVLQEGAPDFHYPDAG